MATRLSDYTIPSSFIRLDDHTTAADSFINIRDNKVARENQNIILARANKRHLLSLFNGNGLDVWYTVQGSGLGGDAVFSLPLMLSSGTQEIEIVVRAKQVGYTPAPSAVNLFFNVSLSGQDGETDTSRDKIAVTSTSYAKYSLTMPIHGDIRDGVLCTVSCYMQGQVNTGTDQFGTDCDVVSSTDRQIIIDTSPGGGGAPNKWEAVYVTSKTDTDHRLIIHQIGAPVGSTNYRLSLDRNFNDKPNPGDKVNISPVAGLQFESLDMYEKGVSDFNNILDIE